jgi:hypothetical protein
VVTRGAGSAATGALVAGAVAPVEDAAVARLECVLSGAVAGAEALGCTVGAEAADETGPAPAVRLAAVRGALADSVGAGAWTPTAVPGRGGAPAAGVRGRCACGGFSCLTIHTVRRTISVRTSTGGGGWCAPLTGRTAYVVRAPSAISVIAPARVMAGFLRISWMLGWAATLCSPAGHQPANTPQKVGKACAGSTAAN